MSSSPDHRTPELTSSSERRPEEKLLSSGARSPWPVLKRAALLFRQHPDPQRTDVKRLADVIRQAERAVARGVGVSAEVWTALCLEHAEVRAANGADPIAALWWALTKASKQEDLQARVAPELHAIVAEVAAAEEAKPIATPFDDVAKRREKLRRELEEKRKRG